MLNVVHLHIRNINIVFFTEHEIHYKFHKQLFSLTAKMADAWQQGNSKIRVFIFLLFLQMVTLSPLFMAKTAKSLMAKTVNVIHFFQLFSPRQIFFLFWGAGHSRNTFWTISYIISIIFTQTVQTAKSESKNTISKNNTRFIQIVWLLILYCALVKQLSS